MKSVTGSTENDLGEANSTAVNEKSLPNLGIMKENTPLQTENLLGGLLNGSSSVHPKAQSSQDATKLEVSISYLFCRVLLSLVMHFHCINLNYKPQLPKNCWLVMIQIPKQSRLQVAKRCLKQGETTLLYVGQNNFIMEKCWFKNSHIIDIILKYIAENCSF